MEHVTKERIVEDVNAVLGDAEELLRQAGTGDRSTGSGPAQSGTGCNPAGEGRVGRRRARAVAQTRAAASMRPTLGA